MSKIDTHSHTHLTERGLDEFLEAAAGRPKPEFCEACNETGRPIVFDANDGKFRGWICIYCKFMVEAYTVEELRAKAKSAEKRRAKQNKEVDAVLAGIEAMESRTAEDDTGTS